MGSAGGCVAVEQVSLDLVDGVAFQGAVGDAGGGLVADVFGHVSDIVTAQTSQPRRMISRSASVGEPKASFNRGGAISVVATDIKTMMP